jgi:hypothetical protein
MDKYANFFYVVSEKAPLLILQNIRTRKKEFGGRFTGDFEQVHPENIDVRSMISIGG